MSTAKGVRRKDYHQGGMSPGRYENEYGSLTYKPLHEFKPVKELGRVKDVPKEYRFDMQEAQRIVLVTENRYSQLSFPYPLKSGDLACLYVHDSSNTAAPVEILSFDYKGPDDAYLEILRLKPNPAVYVGVV